MMNQTGFYKQLNGILSEDQILCKEPMSRHTTFRVGGPADYFIMPRPQQTAEVLALCKREQIPCRIVGNGSNLLVSDAGIRGVVIAFTKQAAQIRVNQDRILAEAGALLSQAAAAACRAELGGMEFAAGIPGSIGGAVVMNAGAYGGELKNILTHAVVMTEEGEQLTLKNEELELSYRHSCIPERHLTVLEAEFQLQKKPQEEIHALMEELKGRRLEKQPLEYPSAGSTFKRPVGNYAGKLIMEAGLAGVSVGGAQVSKKHCGFIINKGNATAADVYGLIQLVRKKVREHSGIELETEVKYVGEFS
uniref:UDP-N-acetylenolpyruvoylglucosamine reductase n=1 Tax=Eubacterium plexicaudatum ASF492 TaxID=1235802 RepID=N2A8K8_9FIRM